MTHDQTTPAPVEVTQADRDVAAEFGPTYYTPHEIRLGHRDYAPIVQAFARHRIAHSAPAGEVEPVLLWEGNELWLGEAPVAWVIEHPQGDAEWQCDLDRSDDDAPTAAEARTAAEQAVRDWLKRAGCV